MASVPTTLEDVLVALLAAMLGARTVVAWTPLVHFDIDPSAISTESVVPFAGFGPAGSLTIDAVTSLLASMLLSSLALRRSIAWTGAVAMLAGVVAALDVCLVLRGDFEQLWRGSAWVSAFLGAGALASCASHPQAGRLRRIAVGVLLSIGMAWLVRGAWQLVVEHPQTVEQFRATKDEFLAAQGWAADSVQAQTYERRLLQREATGWFGLANIMSGLVGAFGLGCAIVLVRARHRLTRGSALALASAVLCSGAVLAINGSKGSLAATLIGGVAAWIACRSAWHARAALLAALALPVLAILARGALGELLDERSLLFRAQYWAGAWSVILDAWPWGCGPDAFQAAYTAHRPERAVEEVTSAHAAPVDWLATMGLAGCAMTAAWVGLLLAASRPGDSSPDGCPAGEIAPDPSDREAWLITLVGLSAIGVAAIMADPDGRTLVAVGILLAALVARGMIAGMGMLGDSGWRVLATGVGAALAAHALVEMTLWQPGSVSWVMGTVGALAMVPRGSLKADAAAASVRAASTTHSGRRCCWPAAVGAVAVLALAAAQATVAFLTARQERAIDAAAHTLVENLFTPPSRALAGEQLRAAAEDEPLLRRHMLLLRAADQFLQAAAGERDPARARVMFDDALAAVDDARAAFPLRAALVRASIIDGMVERGLVGWDQVTLARNDVLAHDPRHTMSWVRLAEAQARSGDAAASRATARHALEVDASFRLDPLRQMSKPVRQRCEAWMAAP